MAWRGPTSNNPVPNKINIAGISGINSTENRATNVRRDTDTQVNFSVTLLDIDTTIFTHLDTTVSPEIPISGVTTKVPILYASPERWIAIQDDGFVRDKNGKIQCPVIAFRRSTMQRNDSLMTLNRYLQYPTVRKFSQKNQYDRFSLMNNFNQVGEVYSVTLPDHVIINYEFIVWTEASEQANIVAEKINFATEDYWGDKHRFKFRTSISDYQFQSEVSVEQDRMVKTTFTMMVYAYLLPDKFENNRSTVQKSFTARKVVVGAESVASADTYPFTQNIATSSVAPTTELNGSQVPILDMPPTSETDPYDSSWINNDIINYQNFLTIKSGSVISVNPSHSLFLFESASFNDSTSTTQYQKLMLMIDSQYAPINSFTYQVVSSSILVDAKTSLLKTTPTTQSAVFAYGNLK